MASTARKGYYCPHCHNSIDAEDSICLKCNSPRRGAWPVDPYVGRTIGRKYKIIRRISASGSGMVFAATQMHMGTELGNVIIKMLSKQVTGDSALTGRFISEARAARTLTSPHMVRVFDLDFDAGHVPYLVMESVVGEPLDDIILQDGKLDPGRALSIAMQVAEGIEEAHQKKILHRNIRPSNIIVRERENDDFVKIIGFSLPKQTGIKGGTLDRSGDDAYSAPETAEGAETTELSDIYSLGATLHEMLCGEVPRRDCSIAEVITDLPMAIVETVDSMLQTDPELRPADMSRIVILLEQAAHEAGYTTDITGRITIPSDALESSQSSVKPWHPAAMSADGQKILDDPPDSPPPLMDDGQTSEVPARSAATTGTRTRRSPLIPVLIALISVLAVFVVAALIVATVIYLRGPTLAQPPSEQPSQMQPPAPETAPPVPEPVEPEQPKEAPEREPAEVAPPPPPPEDETPEPATKKPPIKKIPPIKKKPPIKKQQDTNPWTKL